MVNLPNLKKLDVNTNKLENLNDLPDLPSLDTFDCGANEITTIAELPKLSVFRRLKTLLMLGTPLADEKGEELKLEVLIALDELSIKMVGEDEVTGEDKTAAAEEKKARKEKEEEERAEAERARLEAEENKEEEAAE